MSKLVRGDQLGPAVRAEVLAGFPYRWTHENPRREVAYAGSQQPAVPLISDEQWLRAHYFLVINSGMRLARTGRGCWPASMAPE